jgi:hypothetical protein
MCKLSFDDEISFTIVKDSCVLTTLCTLYCNLNTQLACLTSEFVCFRSIIALYKL